MIFHLPDDILRRIPAKHTFHHWTGTLEYVSTLGSGQRTFLFFPLPGEEHLALNPTSNYTMPADLAVEQFNGHPVVMFGFLSESGKAGFCFAYSRHSGSWLMLNDTFKMAYLFEKTDAPVTAKLFNAFVKTVAGSNSAVILPTNPLTGRAMSGSEIHQLLLAIRQFVTSQMSNNQSANQGGRL